MRCPNALLAAALLFVGLPLSEAQSQTQGFRLDVSREELPKLMGDRTVGELRVGETAVVTNPNLCFGRDGVIRMPRVVIIARFRAGDDLYGNPWQVERGAGDTVVLKAVDRKTRPLPNHLLREHIQTSVKWLQDCDSLSIYGFESTLRVDNINGFRSMSQLLTNQR